MFQPKETLDERQVKHHHCSATTSLCKKTHNFLHSFKVFYQASQNSYKRQALPKYFNTNKKLGIQQFLFEKQYSAREFILYEIQNSA